MVQEPTTMGLIQIEGLNYQQILPSVQGTLDVVKEGLMYVQNPALWRKGCWDRYYITLTSSYLKYQHITTTTSTATTKDTSIKHQTAFLYLDRHVSLSINEERRGSCTHHYIRVKSQKQNRTLNMYCLNHEERDDWMTKILMVLAMKHIEDVGDTKGVDDFSRSFSPSHLNVDIDSPNTDDCEHHISWTQLLTKSWNGRSSRQSSTKSNTSASSESSKCSSRDSRDELRNFNSRYVDVISCYLNNRNSPRSVPKESSLFRRHSISTKVSETLPLLGVDVKCPPLSAQVSRRWLGRAKCLQ